MALLLVLACSAVQAGPGCAPAAVRTPPLCNGTETARSASYFELATLLPTFAQVGRWHDAEVYLPFMAARDLSQEYGGPSCPADESRGRDARYFTWVSRSLRMPILSGFEVRAAPQSLPAPSDNAPPSVCPRLARCAIDGVEATEFDRSGWAKGLLTAPSTLAQLAGAAGQALSMCNAVPQTPLLHTSDWAQLARMVDGMALQSGGIVLAGPLVGNSSTDRCLCPNDVAQVSPTATCASCPTSGIRLPHAFWKLYAHRDGGAWRTWCFIAEGAQVPALSSALGPRDSSVLSSSAAAQTPLQMLHAGNLRRVQQEMGLQFPQAWLDGSQASWLSPEDIVNPPAHVESAAPTRRRRTPSPETQPPLPPWVKASYFNQFGTTTAPVTHPPCSGGRYWSKCGASCTPTCDQMTPICTSECVARCECPLGSMWHGGQCLPPTHCPVPGCANGMYRYTSPITSSHYCLACPPGKYGRAVRGEGFCQMCRPGRFQDRYGAHDEIAQGAAKGAGAALADGDDDGTPCKVCPTGHFANTFGTGCRANTAPLKCDAGTYLALSRHTQRAHCFGCPAGKHGVLVNGNAACFFCGSGTYQPATKQTTCLPCPAGTRATPYRASCQRIAPSDGELPQATVCPSGSFLRRNAPGTGQDVCTECPAGKHRDAASTPDVGCLLCAAGFHQPLSGAAVCSECPIGTYSSSYRTFCGDSLPEPDGPCSVGRYKHESASLRKVGCFACPSGKFGFTLDAMDSARKHVQFSICNTCEPGKHQPEEGSTACLACPAGKHSTFYRAQCTSASRHLCPIGKFRSLERDGGAGNVESLGWAGARTDGVDDAVANNDGRCVDCPVGKYGDTTAGEGECYYCSANFHQPLVGQSKCERCVAGKAASIFRVSCTSPAGALPCPSGHFKFVSTVLDETECAACPAGKYGHKSACHVCPAGQYQDTAARTACITCPTDHSDAAFHQHCMTPHVASGPLACAAGFFMFTSAVTKTSHCYMCPAGKFSARAAVECVDACPAGMHTDGASRRCKACPAGTFQTKPGQLACETCRAGRHTSHLMEGAATEDAGCTACNMGKYQPQAGQSFCIPCLAGKSSSRYRKFCAAPGSFVVCTAGKYHSESGLDPASPDGFAASECISCVPGTFSASGSSKCTTACPAGTQNTPPSSQRCVSCQPGRYRNLAATGLASEFCRTCPNGQFQPDFGSHLCVSCPAGAVVGSNHTRCDAMTTARPTLAPTTTKPTLRCIDSSAAQCANPPRGCAFVNDAGVQRINAAAVAEGLCKPYPCGLRKCNDECKNDITPPVLFLHGPATFAADRSLQSIESLLQFERPFKGYSCIDICDGDVTASAVTSEWRFGGCDGVRHKYDPRTPGTWGLVYACRDSSGHTATACRVITHTPAKTGPQIQLNGPPSITLRAEKGRKHPAFGAKCYDTAGKDLPMVTEIFAPDGLHVDIGLFIDQGTPGLWRVVYHCQDVGGQEAKKERLVLVKDKTCPTCTVTRGQWGGHVVARVPFNPLDEVTCTDDMTGAIAPTVSGRINLDVPGSYVITYHARDGNGNMNDGPDCERRKITYERIIVVTPSIARLHLELTQQDGTYRCTPGMELHAGSCRMCAPGMFQPTPMAACQDCPLGQHQPWAGRTHCIACRQDEIESADRRECASIVPPPSPPTWDALPQASASVADLWLPCGIPEIPPAASGAFGLDSLPPLAPGAAPQKRLRVRCNSDFKLVGDGERICTARSAALGGGWAWSGSQSICVPDKCAASTNPPAVPQHGQVVRKSTGAGQSTRVEAWYACDSGFGLQRSPGVQLLCEGLEPCTVKHTCDATTGVWSSAAPRCMRDCGTPSVPSADMEGGPRVHVKGSTTDGESAYYSCANPAYAFVGSALDRARGVGSDVPGEVRLTCGHDGEWHDDGSDARVVVGRLPGSCEAVDCGPAPDIAHGTVARAGSVFSATAEYTCNHETGHELIGTPTSRCGIDGKWHGVPICTMVSEQPVGRGTSFLPLHLHCLLILPPLFCHFELQVKLCSHVRCKLAVDPMAPSRSNVVNVLHHGSEQHGNAHTCRYMAELEQCACLCYDKDTLALTASSAAT